MASGDAARDGASASPRERETLEHQVVSFLGSKGFSVNSSDIEACHTLPSKNKEAPPAIIMRLCSRKKKQELLKQGSKLKGTNVYLNEHLIKKNADIARKARRLKKQGKIQATWTASCKIFIKLNGSPEEAKVMIIKEERELDKYED